MSRSRWSLRRLELRTVIGLVEGGAYFWSCGSCALFSVITLTGGSTNSEKLNKELVRSNHDALLLRLLDKSCLACAE
jgi:hypothetical protein